jgi:glutamate synthase domain-containing protein 1
MPKKENMNETDYLAETIIHINTQISGAFVASSGKNMGVFKAVGFPEEVAYFYDLEQYEGYMWTAHGRFPTNTPGWWGGAHPFGLLDWTVVHNGEISSYGANYRFLESKGYPCMLMTDTEVILYSWDYLVRKHNLPYRMVASILGAPFWTDLDDFGEDERELHGCARIVYSELLLNGPFSILVTRTGTLMGLTDRIKLRPMVAAEHGDTLYIATEEAALRLICPKPDLIWTPGASELVIGQLKEGVVL